MDFNKGLIGSGNPEVFGEVPVPVRISPPQIPHGAVAINLVSTVRCSIFYILLLVL
jgi:hypothetical protein